MQWRSNAQKSGETLIHVIRPSNTMTVGDVYHTLCKQKQPRTLKIQRMVKEACQMAFEPVVYSK